MVYGLLRDLPGVPGFVATVARKSSCELDLSVGRPGPHGFAVRIARGSSAAATRPSHPASRFVTIGRNAPLLEAGCVGLCG
jgi:hypothetical protein